MTHEKDWPTKLIPIDGGNSIDLLNIISDTKAKYGKSPSEGNWDIKVTKTNGVYISTSYKEHLNNKQWKEL